MDTSNDAALPRPSATAHITPAVTEERADTPPVKGRRHIPPRLRVDDESKALLPLLQLRPWELQERLIKRVEDHYQDIVAWRLWYKWSLAIWLALMFVVSGTCVAAQVTGEIDGAGDIAGVPLLCASLTCLLVTTHSIVHSVQFALRAEVCFMWRTAVLQVPFWAHWVLVTAMASSIAYSCYRPSGASVTYLCVPAVLLFLLEILAHFFLRSHGYDGALRAFCGVCGLCGLALFAAPATAFATPLPWQAFATPWFLAVLAMIGYCCRDIVLFMQPPPAPGSTLGGGEAARWLTFSQLSAQQLLGIPGDGEVLYAVSNDLRSARTQERLRVCGSFLAVVGLSLLMVAAAQCLPVLAATTATSTLHHEQLWLRTWPVSKDYVVMGWAGMMMTIPRFVDALGTRLERAAFAFMAV